MAFSPLLVLHICAAVITVPSGWAALIFRKGSRRHRAAGNAFFISMVIMSASGAYMGFMKQQTINVVVGVLTFYLVATAWAAVKRKEGETGLFEFAAMLVASTVGASGLIFGSQAANSATGLKDGFPAVGYFVFGSVALFSAAGDVRMFLRGGVSGRQRIARHLWRMCFALLIAALSLFLGKQQHFPEAIRKTHLLNVPIILIAVSMIFWLVRVRFSGAYKERGWRSVKMTMRSGRSERSLAPLS
jgi:uncharacterized membrane protein YozB (DUF420 family)